MYQTIGETIEVVGIYRHQSFKPVKFKWNNRVHNVDQITAISEIKDGGVRRRMYSVLVKGNVYRLLFDRQSEIWKLDEVWVEEGV